MIIREVTAAEGAVWAGVGLFVCALGWRFELGSFTEPGPGFMAFFAGLFLCAIGVVMIGSAAAAKRSKRAQQEAAGSQAAAPVPWRRLLFTASLLLLYILFLQTLGYMIGTLLLLSAMVYDPAKKNWPTTLAFSLISVAASYLVFEVWLQCQLPHGFFPWW